MTKHIFVSHSMNWVRDVIRFVPPRHSGYEEANSFWLLLGGSGCFYSGQLLTVRGFLI